ncbi:MAG: hypothetical protein JSR37_05765 [Verrucomicrobia bacterium]|nr:hypothetical protein [Verrucomicrobiota bacterium]
MTSNISLVKILEADWTKEYLTSTGEVAPRTVGVRIVTWLRHAPLIGRIVDAIFPKADLLQASIAVKNEIIEEIKLRATGGSKHPLRAVSVAADRVNELTAKVVKKHPELHKLFVETEIDVVQLFEKYTPKKPQTPPHEEPQEPVVEEVEDEVVEVAVQPAVVAEPQNAQTQNAQTQDAQSQDELEQLLSDDELRELQEQVEDQSLPTSTPPLAHDAAAAQEAGQATTIILAEEVIVAAPEEQRAEVVSMRVAKKSAAKTAEKQAELLNTTAETTPAVDGNNTGKKSSE